MIIIKTDWSFILLKEHGFLIIHVLVKEMCNMCKDENGMPFTNFKIVNAKNKKMEFKKLLKYSISIHWGFNH